MEGTEIKGDPKKKTEEHNHKEDRNGVMYALFPTQRRHPPDNVPTQTRRAWTGVHTVVERVSSNDGEGEVLGPGSRSDAADGKMQR